MAINALFGATSAAVTALVRGEPVRPALLGGAVGGMLIYMGKRLAVDPADGAGMAGRQLAAVGGSIQRNAADGRPPFSELALPVGPLRLYLRPGHGVRLKLDAATTLAALHFGLVRHARFDASASLSSGALVFRDPEGGPTQVGNRFAVGEAGAGSLLLADDSNALAHELIHVLQYDQGLVSVGEPLERALAGLHPLAGALHERVDFGLAAGLHLLGNHSLAYDDRPWEWEAGLLSSGLRRNPHR
jgi:hypothetical protein